jgi:hypothetical protein
MEAPAPVPPTPAGAFHSFKLKEIFKPMREIARTDIPHIRALLSARL